MKHVLKKWNILFVALALVFFGCEDDDDANLPQVTAGFTFTLDEDTGVVTFLNTSENAQTYSWDFGDTTSSTEINPTKVYPTGMFDVTLTATNVAGSSSTFTDQIVVNIPLAVTIPITFDETNVDYTAGTFGGASFEVVANPAPGGSNDQASQVGAITNVGAAFEGIFFDLGTSLDLATEKTITMNFWSESAIDVLLKLEQGTGADTEITASHGGTGWEILTFDFTSADSFDRFTFFVDGSGTTAGTFYIDDIVQSTTAVSTEPTEAAPTPTQDAANVISVFSDAYTDVAGTTARAFGNDPGAVFSEIQVAGDNVWRYESTNFVGTQNDGGFDLTGLTNFSMDIWVAEDLGFRAGLIAFTSPATREDVEVNLTGGQWTTIDVAIADLVASAGSEGALPNDPTINQIIFDVLGDGVEADIFVDNVFFYGAGAAATEPTTAAPTPTQDASSVISVFSDAYTNVAGTTARAFGNDPNAIFSEIQVAGDNVWRYESTNFVGTQNDGGFDLTGLTNFSMDIWVAEDLGFRAGLIAFTSPATREDVEVNLTGGQWTTIDVAITDLVASAGSEGALPDDPTINQIIFDVLGDGVEADIFVDNVFFYGAGAAATEPTTAAPTPTQDASNVISVFSDAYTSVAGTTARAFGNDPNAIFSEIQIAGDNVWRYESTNFVGTQNDGGFDLTGLTNFSMDIWVAEDLGFRAGLIAFTSPATREDVEVNLTGGQWTTIDVAIADLVASAGSEGALPDDPTINQIIFDVLGDGVEADIFVDNVFFYNANAGGGSTGGAVFEEDFSTDTSGNWNPIADAVGKPAEVNLNYLADGGETGGGLEFVLVNATGGAFIHRLEATGIDFSGLTNAEFKFSLKTSATLEATAIQSQLQVLGTSNVDISLNNLETMGLNDATFTEFSIPFTVPDGATGSILFDLNLATGNPGAGGVIIDNISIVEASN